jgi:flagellar motility protein MotE (MotC chaperone)
MIKLSAIAFLALTMTVLASSGEKVYTEEDFVKKVAEEVRKKVDDVKKKSVSELTKELLEKEEKLMLREMELTKRMDALKVTEEDLAKRYTVFEGKQRSFIGCVEKNQAESQARVTQLVDMISNMKPEKAAEVLAIQDSEIAVKILNTLDSKKASKIFNFMDKETSARLQKQLLIMKK